MTANVDERDRARIRAIATERATPEHHRALAERLAARLLEHGAVWFTDCDGVIFPFCDDPRDVAATPDGVVGFRSVQRLVHTRLVAVTGGSLERARTILERAGLRGHDVPLDIHATYGIESSVWVDDRYVETNHVPHDAGARMAAGLDLVSGALRMALSTSSPFASTAAEATEKGRVLLEEKPSIYALHTAQAPGTGKVVDAVMTSPALRHKLAELGMFAKDNNGTWEVGVEVQVDGCKPNKGFVVRSHTDVEVGGVAVDTMIYNADDSGDLPAVKALREFAASKAGREAVVLVVHHEPEHAHGEVKRRGTPASLVEEADAVFADEATLGRFLSDVVDRIAALDHANTALAHAGPATPSA